MKKLLLLLVLLATGACFAANLKLVCDSLWVVRWHGDTATLSVARAAGDSWLVPPWFAVKDYADSIGAAGLVDSFFGWNRKSDTLYGVWAKTFAGAGCIVNDTGAVALGASNTAGRFYTTVGGGLQNAASAPYATVSGGLTDTASGQYSTIGGGTTNVASGNSSTVSGGFENVASEYYATVGGGRGNVVSGLAACVPGGYKLTVTGDSSGACGWSDGSDTLKVNSAWGFYNQRVFSTVGFYKGAALDGDSALATVQFVRDSGGGGGGTTDQQARDTATAALRLAERDSVRCDELYDTLAAIVDTLAIVRDTANQALADAATALDTARTALDTASLAYHDTKRDSTWKWGNATDSFTSPMFIGDLTGNVTGRAQIAESAVGSLRVGGKTPTATPGANAIPISPASGYLNGWMSPSFVLATYASALPCTSAVYKLIPYGTEVKDNLNEFSAGVFTAAASGYYTINAGISTASTAWSAGNLTVLYLYIDGVVKYALNPDIVRWAGTYVAYPRGGISVYLAAGQTADVRFYQNSGGIVNTGTLAIANFISIMRGPQ